MKKRNLFSCMLLGALLFPLVSFGLEGKKERVDEAMRFIEQYAHGKRIAGGVILTGLAAGFGVGSFLASRSENEQTRQSGAIVLGATATVFAVAGIGSFITPVDFEKLPLKYRTDHESELIGERYLIQLRDQARTHRLVSTSAATAIGVSEVVAYLAGDRGPGTQWLVYSGGALTALGLFGLLYFETIPEKAWNNYLSSGSLSSESGGELSIAVFPQANGLSLQARLVF